MARAAPRPQRGARRAARAVLLLLCSAAAVPATAAPTPTSGSGRALLDAGADKARATGRILCDWHKKCKNADADCQSTDRRHRSKCLWRRRVVPQPRVTTPQWCAGADHCQHLQPGRLLDRHALVPGRRQRHRRPGVHQQQRAGHQRAVLCQRQRLRRAPRPRACRACAVHESRRRHPSKGSQLPGVHHSRAGTGPCLQASLR